MNDTMCTEDHRGMHECNQVVFVNSMFESAAPEQDNVAAELQAALLRLDAAEGERAALSSELASVEARLHNALEVLEGLLAERTSLLHQTHDLRAQLEAAMADECGGTRCGYGSTSPARSVDSASNASDATASDMVFSAGTPRQQLRRELLVARAQLAELQAAQRAWEAERAALLSEVEEERQRLQEGLAEALTQASCAQRDADAAAERASHWCSLAQVLQRSALLSEGGCTQASPLGKAHSPASTASTASCYSPVGPVRSVAKMPGSAPASAARSSHTCGGVSVSQLLAELRSQASATSASELRFSVSPSPHDDGRCESAAGRAEELIAAFHAAALPPSAEEQPRGCSIPEPCSSPVRLKAFPAADRGKAAGQEAGAPAHAAALAGMEAVQHEISADDMPLYASLAASAELAPGTSLHFLHCLPAPGVSRAASPSSSSGPGPVTPAPCAAAMAAPGAAAAVEPTRSKSTGDVSGDASSDSQNDYKQRKQGLLGRLLMKAVCAGGLAPSAK